ncbi:MAG TPA: hypothetical protein VK646_02315, partial [Actinomycetota bacterium]|nr:hypothetical protein [Actinomycetota bacterium]
MLHRVRSSIAARPRALRVRLLIGAGLAALALTACTVTTTPLSQNGSTPSWPAQASDAAQAPLSTHRGVVGVVQKVMPAVVNVVNESSQGKAEGTGFVVRSDGIIVTNYHVVEDAQQLKV